MTTVKIDAGRVEVLIPDADGKEQTYSCVPVDSATHFTLDLTRTSGKRPGKTYRVTLDVDGADCACPDHQFLGHAKREQSCCKHVSAARDIRNMLLAFTVGEQQRQSLEEVLTMFDASN